MQRKVLFYCLLLASLLEDKLCSEFVKFSFSFSSLFFLWHQARKRFEVCFLLQSKKAKKSNSGFCFVLLGGEIISIMQMTNKKKIPVRSPFSAKGHSNFIRYVGLR